MLTRTKSSPLVTREYDGARRHRGPLIVGAVGVAVLAAVILILNHNPAPSDISATPQGPASTSSAGANPVLPEQDPSRLHSPSDPDWLTAAPAGLVWSQIDRVSLPFTSADGPRRIDEESGAATGYSQTPQGAVVAAYQIAMRIALGTHYADVVDAQTVFDPTSAADVKEHRGSPDPSALGDVHPSAFKVLAYLSSQATVQYALPNPMNGSYNSYQFTVLWTADDWKLVAPNDTASAATLNTITGFTPF